MKEKKGKEVIFQKKKIKRRPNGRRGNFENSHLLSGDPEKGMELSTTQF